MRYIWERLCVVVFCLANMVAGLAQVKSDVQPFIAGLDSIRVELKIPAMAAAVMEGDSILFAEGFGYSDLQNHIKATANTSFRIASITKTFTSTLIMQLVEQGKLDLESPVSVYGLDFGNPHITVKNLLTHTSEGEPGSHYQYNGFRFGQLGTVIEKATGKPFYQLLMEHIVKPLNMSSTAPGNSPDHYLVYTQQNKDMLPYFDAALSHLAKPYELNEKAEIVETKYLDEFGAFGGLASTVNNLLKYSAAIDRNQFVTASTQKKIFTANRTKNGELTPYGLGWFTQTYKSIDFYWHYGQTQGESGLFVKVPSKNLTLVVLANTDRLSQPFPLGDGDLFTSPVGQLFYKYYLSEGHRLAIVDYHLPIGAIRKKLTASKQDPFKDFYNKELVAQAAMAIVTGDTARAMQFYNLYANLNFANLERPPSGLVIAAIRDAGINQDITKSFTLTKPTRLRVYGVGENCSGDFTSWCDYGWIEDSKGKKIWQMQGQPAKHAGGAIKNQRVDKLITLPAGGYKLCYKSDAGHAYNNWDSAPPDHFFWGIVLLRDSNK
jgi:CubicO group peptidase (beta-lactamase class C family)